MDKSQCIVASSNMAGTASEMSASRELTEYQSPVREDRTPSELYRHWNTALRRTRFRLLLPVEECSFADASVYARCIEYLAREYGRCECNAQGRLCSKVLLFLGCAEQSNGEFYPS